MSNRGRKINDNNDSTMKRTRHRSPVPPSFPLPNRGEQCCNWLPIAKRELTSRAKGLNQQRLEAIEIIINRVIGVIFTLFSVNCDNIKFRLNCDVIINGLIQEWNAKLLSTWNGPKFRSTSWREKKWEGKHGYYKLCKNWSDQNKSKVAHKFWIPLFEQILAFIRELSLHQFKHNPLLQSKFEDITRYSCFYSICNSKVAFPKTRALPLFLDTAMTKNGQIRRYLKTFDQNLNIFQFKEEESEKYNREQRICQAVKQRCVEYLGQSLLSKLNQFFNENGINNPIELSQLIFEIKYDTKGKIGRDTNACSNDDDNHNNDYNDDHQDEVKVQESVFASPSILTTSLSTTSSSSSTSSSSLSMFPNVSSSMLADVSSSSSSSSSSIAPMLSSRSLSLPAPRQIGNENEYLSAECEIQGAKPVSMAYGSLHGQPWRVRQSRHTPFTRMKPERNFNDTVPVYGFHGYYAPYYPSQPIRSRMHPFCCCDHGTNPVFQPSFHCINPSFMGFGYSQEDVPKEMISLKNSINGNRQQTLNNSYGANDVNTMSASSIMDPNMHYISNLNHNSVQNAGLFSNGYPLQPQIPPNYFN